MSGVRLRPRRLGGYDLVDDGTSARCRRYRELSRVGPGPVVVGSGQKGLLTLKGSFALLYVASAVAGSSPSQPFSSIDLMGEVTA